MALRISLTAAVVALALAGCATLPDPPQVTVAGVASLPSEDMEIRMLLKLRVQNPNDSPIEYSGASVTLDVADKTFATGVSDAAGTVPRFGEAVIEVPMAISMMRMARQFMGVLDGQPVDRITYQMNGKLARRGAPDVRFSSQGELQLPGAGR
jgi:LEA14-like dessication related protein